MSETNLNITVEELAAFLAEHNSEAGYSWQNATREQRLRRKGGRGTVDCEYVASWEPTPKRGPFCGFWRVQEVPCGTMICVSAATKWAATREGIKRAIANEGGTSPVRFVNCPKQEAQ